MKKKVKLSQKNSFYIFTMLFWDIVGFILIGLSLPDLIPSLSNHFEFYVLLAGLLILITNGTRKDK